MDTKRKIILLIIVVAIITGAVITSPWIFQEGNPLPLFYGIGILYFSDHEIVEIGDGKFISEEIGFQDPNIKVDYGVSEWDPYLIIGGIRYKADWNIYLGKYKVWYIR